MSIKKSKFESLKSFRDLFKGDFYVFTVSKDGEMWFGRLTNVDSSNQTVNVREYDGSSGEWNDIIRSWGDVFFSEESAFQERERRLTKKRKG